MLSIAQEFADLEEADRETVLNSVSEEEAAAYLKDWGIWARPEQLTPPGAWAIWLVIAGRGWGKSLTGAQDVLSYGRTHPGSRIAVVAPTYADARDTCVEGESGLLGRLEPTEVATWNRSLGELILTNGTRYKLFSSEEPDRLRGPQHHRAWGDEIASWTYPEATYDMLMLGMRLGDNPRVVLTTTPKPIRLVKDLIKRAGRDVHLTRGHTFENRENLASSFIHQIVHRMAGTRLARQELAAEILEDVEGALWTYDLIERCRIAEVPPYPPMDRVVVAVDPSGGDGEGNDEQGIVVVAKAPDGKGYVLADRSCRLSPDGWGRQAVQAYLDFEADSIVAEANFGGDMVLHTIRTAAEAMARQAKPTKSVPVEMVHASRGKRLRAEPIAALYEQNRISHVGAFPELESQMAGWVPGMPSPDRLDALVHACTAVMLSPDRRATVGEFPFAGYRG